MKFSLTLKRFVIISSFALVAMVCSSAVAQQPFEPQEEHEILKMDVGVWHAKGKMWMPGAEEATEFEGVETNRMVGVWVISDYKGEFFGQKFAGHAMSGYDLNKKKYIGIWVDSMSGYPSKMVGDYDAEKKTLTMESTNYAPDSGEEFKGKSVMVYKDKNTRLMTMYMPNPEKEGEMMKQLEIVYTRKKAEKKAEKKASAIK